MSQRGEESSGEGLQLESLGLTLLGVVVSIGVTVAFGVKAEWWIRLLAGAGTVVILVLMIGFGARPGRGPIARLAAWITRRPS